MTTSPTRVADIEETSMKQESSDEEEDVADAGVAREGREARQGLEGVSQFLTASFEELSHNLPCSGDFSLPCNPGDTAAAAAALGYVERNEDWTQQLVEGDDVQPFISPDCNPPTAIPELHFMEQQHLVRAGRMPVCLLPMHFFIVAPLLAIIQRINSWLHGRGFAFDFDGSCCGWRAYVCASSVPGGGGGGETYGTRAEINVYESWGGSGERERERERAVEMGCMEEFGDKFLVARLFWEMKDAVQADGGQQQTYSYASPPPDQRLVKLQDVLVNIASSFPLTTEDHSVVADTLIEGTAEQYEVVLTGIAREAIAAFQAAPSNQHRLQQPIQSALVVLGTLCRELQWARDMVTADETFTTSLASFRLLIRAAYTAPEMARDRAILEHRISSIIIA